MHRHIATPQESSASPLLFLYQTSLRSIPRSLAPNPSSFERSTSISSRCGFRRYSIERASNSDPTTPTPISRTATSRPAASSPPRSAAYPSSFSLPVLILCGAFSRPRLFQSVSSHLSSNHLVVVCHGVPITGHAPISLSVLATSIFINTLSSKP